MRTTITLDEDVAIVIDRLRRSRKESLKEIVNEALREGLKRLDAPRDQRPPVRTRSVDLGRCRLDNVDDIAEVLAIAEGEAFK